MHEWKYILSDDGKTPLPEPDLLKWGHWYQNRENRRVAFDMVDTVEISTVFLGLDHSLLLRRPHKPVLWETMIFGGELDQYQERYSSWDDAIEGHQRAVMLVVMEKQLKV